MANRQEQRSEETKQLILDAAGSLFASRGYDAVTMRQIAKEAGCSHTTIYIYFKDKEALLQALSIPTLLELKQQLEAVLGRPDAGIQASGTLKDVSRLMIRFCLNHRTMYTIFFMVKAAQVDEKEPELAMNALRNALFALLSEGLRRCLPDIRNEQQQLAFSRIYYYMLQGIVGTYAYSEEPLESIMGRLASTFDEAIDIMLLGFGRRLEEEA